MIVSKVQTRRWILKLYDPLGARRQLDSSFFVEYLQKSKVDVDLMIPVQEEKGTLQMNNINCGVLICQKVLCTVLGEAMPRKDESSMFRTVIGTVLLVQASYIVPSTRSRPTSRSSDVEPGQEDAVLTSTCDYDLRQRKPMRRPSSWIYPPTVRGPKVYCLCRKADDGRLYWNCNECREWYHPSCIGRRDDREPDVFFCSKCQAKGHKERVTDDELWNIRRIEDGPCRVVKAKPGLPLAEGVGTKETDVTDMMLEGMAQVLEEYKGQDPVITWKEQRVLVPSEEWKEEVERIVDEDLPSLYDIGPNSDMESNIYERHTMFVRRKKLPASDYIEALNEAAYATLHTTVVRKLCKWMKRPGMYSVPERIVHLPSVIGDGEYNITDYLKKVIEDFVGRSLLGKYLGQ